jgi:hypothetical protein
MEKAGKTGMPSKNEMRLNSDGLLGQGNLFFMI